MNFSPPSYSKLKRVSYEDEKLIIDFKSSRYIHNAPLKWYFKLKESTCPQWEWDKILDRYDWEMEIKHYETQEVRR